MPWTTTRVTNRHQSKTFIFVVMNELMVYMRIYFRLDLARLQIEEEIISPNY